MIAQKEIIGKAFGIKFQDLKTWSVSAQFSVNWSWADEVIKPLRSILSRRNENALEKLTPDSLVTLLTIRFDGTIEPREPVHLKDIKGKLFRVYPGDVVFSKIDVRNGAIGLAPDDIDFMCATSEFPIYSVKLENAHPEYVQLLFRTTIFMKVLNSMISGTSGRKRIQPSQLEGVKVPIPEIHIQQKIVSFWRTAKKEQIQAEKAFNKLLNKLNSYLIKRTNNFTQIAASKFFVVKHSETKQWDIKSGRAATFFSGNPHFVRLGDFTEECSENINPRQIPEKKWLIFGVNNKDGVFLSSKQKGKEFNASYKKIEKNWFFHNPTRANVGSLGIVPDVPVDAITSPEYQVWRLKSGFLPEFMALMIRTEYFLKLVSFNRVGGVKQRMYYSNLAEIRLPQISEDVQKHYANQRTATLNRILLANKMLSQRRSEIEEMILGTRPLEID